MSKHWFNTFLQDNGHIIMLWAKVDNLQQALEALVSTSASLAEIQNFFGIDLKEVLWEYILLPEEERNLLNGYCKAKYNATVYVAKN